MHQQLILLYKSTFPRALQLVSQINIIYYKVIASKLSYFVGGGIDYNSGPFDCLFPAGMTFAELNISIIDDNIVEGDENFTLSINPSSLPYGVIAIHPGHTTVTITDNDCEL